jgi:sugar/nucleoside kinase (ribokinase family)
MNQTSLICGSLAIDFIMQHEGRFADSLLADQLHKVNVSFLVPTMRTEFGGCSGNIAYNLKLLGGEGRIVGVMGQDSGPYLARLQKLRHRRQREQPDQRLPPGRHVVRAREPGGQRRPGARGHHFAGRPPGHAQARRRPGRAGHPLHVRSGPADADV